MLLTLAIMGVFSFWLEKALNASPSDVINKKDILKILVILLCVMLLFSHIMAEKDYVYAEIENQKGNYYFNDQTLCFYENTTTQLELALNPFAKRNFIKLEEEPEWFSLKSTHSYICTCGHIKGDTLWAPYCPACGKKQNPERCEQCESKLSWTETMCSECGAHILK